MYYSNVLPNFGDKNADGNDLSGNANTINGDLNSIKHYIGELFFYVLVNILNVISCLEIFP